MTAAAQFESAKGRRYTIPARHKSDGSARNRSKLQEPNRDPSGLCHKQWGMNLRNPVLCPPGATGPGRRGFYET